MRRNILTYIIVSTINYKNVNISHVHYIVCYLSYEVH